MRGGKPAVLQLVKQGADRGVRGAGCGVVSALGICTVASLGEVRGVGLFPVILDIVDEFIDFSAKRIVFWFYIFPEKLFGV